MLQRIAIALVLLASTVVAQPASSPATQDSRPKYLAHLVTFSPGKLVYERFGHNAIFITDLTQTPPVTVAYDFGNFDFNEADFVRRFLFGEMRYWAAEKDAGELLYGYAADNRIIHRQELNLTDEQVQQLWINLRENIRDENRFYHYDYYLDNCSTRLRDYIDRVIGGQLSAALRGKPAGHSFRWHTRVGMDDERLLSWGIEFAAASPTDAAVSRWEECFLPEQLRLSLQGLTIQSPDGRVVPLVRREGTMNVSIDRALLVTLPDEPANPLWWFAVLGAVIGGGLAGCGAMAARSTLGKWLAAIAWGGWGLFAGLGGCLLVFLWGLTRHVAAYQNENLLQVSPLALLLVVLGPMAAFGRLLGLGQWLARLLLGFAVIGFLLKALPGWRQDNWAIIAFAVMSQAGLLAGMLMRGSGRARTPVLEGTQ